MSSTRSQPISTIALTRRGFVALSHRLDLLQLRIQHQQDRLDQVAILAHAINGDIMLPTLHRETITPAWRLVVAVAVFCLFVVVLAVATRILVP